MIENEMFDGVMAAFFNRGPYYRSQVIVELIALLNQELERLVPEAASEVECGLAGPVDFEKIDEACKRLGVAIGDVKFGGGNEGS